MRSSTLVLLLATALLAQQGPPFPTGAQPNQPAANRPTHTITGTVVNSVTSDPVRRALVRVECQPQPMFAFSGDDGRFSINDIPEGRWMIHAQRPGYINPQQMPVSSSPRNFLHTVSSSSNDFKIELTPESSVTGVVTDSDGNPIEGLQVQVLTEYINQGRKQHMPRGGASTDDSGTYRIENLAPGSILLRTASHPLAAGRFTRATQAYPESYYPNTPDLASAQPIEVKAGQEARADFSLSPTPVFSVSGTISGLPSSQRPMVMRLDNDGTQTGFTPLQYDASSGRFTIGMVPPGSSTLRFTSNDGKGGTYEATEQINIDGANVTGLQVMLQPGNEIPVQVNALASNSALSNTPTGQNGPNNSMQIWLLPLKGGMRQNYFAGGGTPEKFRGVPPGQYHVAANTFGQSCVESITYGGTDLSHDPLVISQGASPQPVVVNLRNDCASLTGTVHQSNPDSTAVVLLTSSSPFFQPKQMNIGANATFTFSNLAPGTYRIYALSDINGLEYANPDAMRDISGHDLELQSGQKETVTLDVVERSANQ